MSGGLGRARARVAAGGLGLAALATLLAGAVAPPRAEARELLVVQANVGNVNIPGCAEHVLKLSLRRLPARARGSRR